MRRVFLSIALLAISAGTLQAQVDARMLRYPDVSALRKDLELFLGGRPFLRVRERKPGWSDDYGASR